MGTLPRFTGSHSAERGGEGEREHMMDVKTITDMLETYVRPATFPVGLKMLQPGEAFPPRTHAWGCRLALCHLPDD